MESHPEEEALLLIGSHKIDGPSGEIGAIAVLVPVWRGQHLRILQPGYIILMGGVGPGGKVTRQRVRGIQQQILLPVPAVNDGIKSIVGPLVPVIVVDPIIPMGLPDDPGNKSLIPQVFGNSQVHLIIEGSEQQIHPCGMGIFPGQQ